MTTSKLTLDFAKTAATLSSAVELLTNTKAPGIVYDRDAIAFELATLLDNLYRGIAA